MGQGGISESSSGPTTVCPHQELSLAWLKYSTVGTLGQGADCQPWANSFETVDAVNMMVAEGG